MMDTQVRTLIRIARWAGLAPALLLAFAGCGGRATVPVASPSTGPCCGEFDYVLEATVFKIDVVHLNLHVDRETATSLAAIRESGPRTPQSEDDAARALLGTTSARARMTFLVGISADQFLDQTERIIRGLGSEGLLLASEVESLVVDAMRRFAFLEGSGIRAGDRLHQVLRGDSVTTIYTSSQGEERLHETTVGREHRAALLGSYFARTSDFREGLLDLVFRGE